MDRVIKIDPGKSIQALKNVTANESFFEGHFPEMKIMPGVLIVEFMAQVAGVLSYATSDSLNNVEQDLNGKVVYFMSMDKVKFRKPVIPGDCLRGEVVLTRSRGNIASFEGKAYVEDTLVAEAEMKAVLIDREAAAEKAAERK